MLSLKTAHELNWGELQYIENPMMAKSTIERNNGNSVNDEPIHNANNYNLPDAFTRSINPYSEIHHKLENGHVFLVNTSTINPLLKNLKITDKQTTQCTIMPGQTLMFKNSVNAMLCYVRVPHITGVLRQEPAQGNADKQPDQKIEREKHVILLDLAGQNDRPLPIKHNIILLVENTTQGNSAVRQLNDVIYNPFSRVFTTEQGDGLKVYAIPDSLIDVKKDLNKNKNLSQSESAGLIAALQETGQETRADGAILHHMKYEVSVPLSLNVRYEFGRFERSTSSDVLVLDHEGSDWSQAIYVAKQPNKVVDKEDSWITVKFENLPEKGKFSLYQQNQKTHASPVTLFSELEYADIVKPPVEDEIKTVDKIEASQDDADLTEQSLQWDEWLESRWA
jgi:hypothetical protein